MNVIQVFLMITVIYPALLTVLMELVIEMDPALVKKASMDLVVVRTVKEILHVSKLIIQ